MMDDLWMIQVEFFRREFAALPGGPVVLVPALGEDIALQLVQQANTVGGCDCVMVHPDFLLDQR